MLRILLILLAVAAACLAEPEITVLDNGLTVIIEEMHYAPVAASVLSYRVGSRNETGSDLGMSHFCEHMMFKGTPTMPNARFWQIVQRDGGWANAFTSNDVTAYMFMLPATRLEDALRIESDRMVNCRIDSLDVVSERGVVHDERRMRSIDSPGGALAEALDRTAFLEHPYRNPVIGCDETILAYDRAGTCEYYRRFYGPSNAVLALIGDFDSEEVLRMVEDHFGDIPDRTEPFEPDIVEPEQIEPRRVEIDHPSNLQRLTIAFHTPAGNHPDTQILEMIATHLSGGRSSWLEQELVQSGVASSAWAYNDGGIDPGLFRIGVVLNPERSPEEALELIRSELDRLAAEELGDDHLEEIRERTRASLIFSRTSPVYLALDMSLNTTMFSDPFKSEKDLQTIESSTAQDIVRVASSYFDADRATVAVLNPTGGRSGGPGRQSRELPTDIQEPSTIDYEGLEIPEELLTLPESSVSEGVVAETLDNGLTVLVLEDHSYPIAAISFAIPMGQLREEPELAGLASVTAEMMLRGPEGLSYGQFHRRLESEGSYIRFGSGPEFSSGSVRVLAEDTDLALGTIADLLLNPAFRPDDFERVMQEARTGVEAKKERGFSLATDNLGRMLAADPAQARVTTMETLDNIDLPTAVSFYETCSRPVGSVITVVGDVEPEEIVETIEEMFGSWSDPNSVLPEAQIPEPSPLPGDTMVATMPGRIQATALIAAPGPGYAAEDYVEFTVMNTILGSGIGSRLGHYVRDDQGLAYVVGSYLMAFRDGGYFTSYLQTMADYAPQAIASVQGEIDRLVSDGVMDIELQLVQSKEVGRHALSGASYSSLARGLTDTWTSGRPLDYDLLRLTEVLELSPEDIREIAREYLDREGWFVSVAGGLDDQLEPVAVGVD